MPPLDPVATQPAAVSVSRPPRAHLVLVVDDDLAIRETLAEVLDDEGYEVLTARDGRDALDVLRNPPMPRRPSIILLDMMMPVMTGAQFYREQQADKALASIPVCLISADGDIRNKAAALGCQYLEKPVRIEQILKLVERHCA